MKSPSPLAATRVSLCNFGQFFLPPTPIRSPSQTWAKKQSWCYPLGPFSLSYTNTADLAKDAHCPRTISLPHRMSLENLKKQILGEYVIFRAVFRDPAFSYCASLSFPPPPEEVTWGSTHYSRLPPPKHTDWELNTQSDREIWSIFTDLSSSHQSSSCFFREITQSSYQAHNLHSHGLIWHDSAQRSSGEARCQPGHQIPCQSPPNLPSRARWVSLAHPLPNRGKCDTMDFLT